MPLCFAHLIYLNVIMNEVVRRNQLHLREVYVCFWWGTKGWRPIVKMECWINRNKQNLLYRRVSRNVPNFKSFISTSACKKNSIHCQKMKQPLKLTVDSESSMDNIRLEVIAQPAPRTLRPLANITNPYPYGCSVLCNHPRDPELKDVVWRSVLSVIIF